jgi:hypothetical protein
LIVLVVAVSARAQSTSGSSLADVIAQRDRVRNADTRVRVDALHRVWAAALASPESAVKTAALELLKEPAGSASDHIRMPAVYAIAEIANSTDDPQVKTRALAALAEPLQASQVPIRDVAIDAVNSITRASRSRVSLEVVRALTGPVRSGNNGVRIPAMNAIVLAVQGSTDPSAYQAALDALVAALETSAAIGGMEVRMMAIGAVERVGRGAPDVSTKAKAMGLLQAYAARAGWEPEAKARALDAASKIEASIKQP